MAQTRKKIRAVWLGQALKEIRESTKLTMKQVGEHIDRDSSTVSRMENGEVSVPEQILDGILEVCGFTDNHRIADLKVIRQDAAQGGWWDGYRKDVASTLMDRAWMESKAMSIQAFDITYIPGLFQLPSYAENIMRAWLPETSKSEIARWVEVRMQRQHVLTKYRPVQFASIIDEQLLHRVVGDEAVMREQLDFLAEVSQRPNVELRILPADKCSGIAGSFELFELVDPYPEIAYLATPAGDICVESDSLGELVQAYDRLQEASLNPEASRELIISERDKL